MAEASLRGIRLFNLSGRSAAITGGSKGLCLAMAAGLASAGANLMLVNR
jgi:gluconate 5-dehydrogenase